MKSLSKMTLRSVFAGMILFSISLNVSAQHKGKTPKSNAEKSAGAQKSTIKNMRVFKKNDNDANWGKYMKDADFKLLVQNLKQEGFKKADEHENFSWGYSGKLIKDSTQSASAGEDVEICVFDFYKKTAGGFQLASIVWRNVGGDIYKASMVYPENEKELQPALVNAVEKTVENGKIVLAHSLSRCWANCVFSRFTALNCAAALTVCGGAAVALVALPLGVTQGAALAVLAGCAGAFCVLPLAICLAYCY